MSRKLYLLAAVFAALFAAALAIDLNILAFNRAGRLPGDLRKLFELAEVFGHGVGVACIVLAVVVLAPARRRRVWRLLACAYGSGLMANVLKLVVARHRPRDLEFQSVADTFVGWCPWLFSDSSGETFTSGLQSFPSAHTATAVGLAIGLTWLYPRGRWLFAAFAALAAAQRVVANAHFLSDTLAGAALGCLVAAACLDRRIFGKWFDRLECQASVQCLF